MFKNFLSIKVKWRHLKTSSTIVHIVVKFEGNSRRWKLACFFQRRYRTQPSSWTIKTTLFYKTQQKNNSLQGWWPTYSQENYTDRWMEHDIRRWFFLRETRQHRQHLPLFSCEVAKRTLSTKKNIVATETITHQNQSKMMMIRLPPKKKKRIPLSLSLQAAA